MPRIQCPSCEATYELPDGSIGPGGRKVRCAACKTLWIASAVEIESPREIPAMEVEPVVSTAAPLQETPRRPWHERVQSNVPAGRPSRGRILLAGALVAGIAGAVALRRHIVAAVPETGAAFAALGLKVNLRGLDLKGVHSTLVSESGGDMLVVQGEIVNLTKDKKAVPRLHFTVRDARGLTLYSWTAQADARDLGPGDVLQFRRRLASPPAEGQDVLVRFATRADLVASAR